MGRIRTLPSKLRLFGLVLCGLVLSACSPPDGRYYVTAESLNVRDAPEIGTVVDTLSRDESVRVVHQQAGWAQLESTGGRAGSRWVSMDYLASQTHFSVFLNTLLPDGGFLRNEVFNLAATQESITPEVKAIPPPTKTTELTQEDPLAPSYLPRMIAQSHQEYSKRHQGYQSSFLPRIGVTKGDDYRNCIERNYNGPHDAHDFCAWHAGIGPYQ